MNFVLICEITPYPYREKISVEAEVPSIDIAKEAIQEKEELFEEALEKRQLRCARSYNDHSIQPCAAVLYCVYVLVYSWARLLTSRDQLPTMLLLSLIHI